MGHKRSSWNIRSNERKPLKMPNSYAVFSFSKHDSVFEISRTQVFTRYHFSLISSSCFLLVFKKNVLHLRCLRAQSKACACLSLLIQIHTHIVHNLEYTPSHDTNFTIIYRFFLVPSFIHISLFIRGKKTQTKKSPTKWNNHFFYE